ncbi:LysR family transcriptional regulator [Lichenicoccus sp.]|uniref:LysR family transcriptional regulator n=1 Tax=Lichenicoccus sp. TaxID=2781899 RepID=UPI003D0D00D0
MRGSEFAELRAFAEVARRQSFARAAEHLRVAPSTLSQTVRALEERLGITLLSRTTRRVSLTSAGARLLERFAPALDEMEAAVAEAHDGRARPRGVVRLHALRPAYAGHVEPMLGHLRETLPDVTLDLTVDDAPLDVAASGYDLIIRRAPFVDDGMVAYELGSDLRHAAVASPGYLATCDVPASPEALAKHRCILWRPAKGETQRWRFEVAGEAMTVAVAGPLIVSHCEAAVAAALQGVGIAFVLQSYAVPFTDSGRLVSLLAEFLPPLAGWKLCHPRQFRLTAAARAVADVLTHSV